MSHDVHLDAVLERAAAVLRPHVDELRLPAPDDPAGPDDREDPAAPTAMPAAVDPAAVIAALSLLMSVLTFWQTERHHREEMDRDARDRQAALREEVGSLAVSGDRLAGELAAVPPEDLDAARAALVDDPAVRADVAALLGRAGVPVIAVGDVLAGLAEPGR